LAAQTEGFKAISAKTAGRNADKYKLEIHAGRKGANAIYNDIFLTDSWNFLKKHHKFMYSCKILCIFVEICLCI
jgi:hypothetical protein